MHWFAVLAYAAIAKKLVQRYRRGNEVDAILADPDHLRTLAQFSLAEPAHAHALLVAIGSALGLAGWTIEGTTLRARRDERDVDVIRLVLADGRYTLELTRAWTGAKLGESTRALLIVIHDVLAADPRVHRLGWHQRQDRALALPHPAPVAV